jgi:thiamine-monophosphate kinase
MGPAFRDTHQSSSDDDVLVASGASRWWQSDLKMLRPQSGQLSPIFQQTLRNGDSSLATRNSKLETADVPLPELALIQRIRRSASRGRTKAGRGIGDDCAILNIPRGHEVLVTTDFSLEGIHFRRDWHPPDSIGHRCLTRGLSDIAAMGGTPIAAFLSLALPADLPQQWVDEFIRGFLKLAKRYSVTLAGGDTSQSPNGILADIVVVGSVPKSKAILRSGARPGEIIYVSGTLGASVATLEELRAGKKRRPASHVRHFYPDPRIALGQYLREKKLASAMIDTSDGLSTDLRHICDESRVGAVVEAAALPKTPGKDGLQLALHGGEDYELLFTAPANKRVPAKIAGVPITRIGTITSSKQIKLRTSDGKSQALEPHGWQHFA